MDIGFGDVISPAREAHDYPALLELPAPRIWTYPRETMVAEKFEAMLRLGARNSRVKDLWDILCLSRRFGFDGETLRAAIEETLMRRGTASSRDPRERPDALSPDYFLDAERTRAWGALLKRLGAPADRTFQLVDAGEELLRFLGPIFEGLFRLSPFTRTWPAGGPWRRGIGVLGAVGR